MTTEQQKMGALIRAKRKEKHWTQAKLAEQLNLTRDAIFAYEKGKVLVIPFEKRIKLSKVLNIPISKLLYASEYDIESPSFIKIATDVLQQCENNIHSKEFTAIDDLFFNATLKDNNFLKECIDSTKEESISNALYYIFNHAKKADLKEIYMIVYYIFRVRGLSEFNARPLASVFEILYLQYFFTPEGENIAFIKELRRDYWGDIEKDYEQNFLNDNDQNTKK